MLEEANTASIGWTEKRAKEIYGGSGRVEVYGSLGFDDQVINRVHMKFAREISIMNGHGINE
jgi:hypothetical protein